MNIVFKKATLEDAEELLAVQRESFKEVSVSESIKISEALVNAGGKVDSMVIPNMGHEICTKIFESNELYKWIENNTIHY